jgi:hypothetical protein
MTRKEILAELEKGGFIGVHSWYERGVKKHEVRLFSFNKRLASKKVKMNTVASMFPDSLSRTLENPNRYDVIYTAKSKTWDIKLQSVIPL